MKRTKLHDIAKEANISTTTVSRYFNNPDIISNKTKLKIEKAINALNYTPDYFAANLAKGHSNLVGLILPHLHQSFYTELLNQLISKGKEKNYHIIVFTSNSDKESELELIKCFQSYRVKGVILLTDFLNNEDIENIPLPIIAIERPGGNFKQINNDNFNGAKIATEKLIQDHCDVVIHINNGYHKDWPSFKRILGFEVMSNNIQNEIIIEKEFTDPYSQKAFSKMDKIIKNLINKYQNKKLGFFCSNDDIAHLCIRQCVTNKLQIPEEVEVIGYDNSPVSETSILRITSVNQNIPLMADLAINALDDYQAFESVVPATLIIKETTLK